MPYKNLDKALLFLRNQVFCLKIWKLWRAPTTLQFNIFCWHFAHVFYLPISTKWCVGLFRIFFILFRSWLVCKKIKKTWFLHTRFFTFLLITLDLPKLQKNPEHLKILNSMVVGACQSFQFFRQITWFLRNNRALS